MIGALGIAMAGGLALLASWGLKEAGAPFLAAVLGLSGAGAIGFSLAGVLA